MVGNRCDGVDSIGGEMIRRGDWDDRSGEPLRSGLIGTWGIRIRGDERVGVIRIPGVDTPGYRESPLRDCRQLSLTYFPYPSVAYKRRFQPRFPRFHASREDSQAQQKQPRANIWHPPTHPRSLSL